MGKALGKKAFENKPDNPGIVNAVRGNIAHGRIAGQSNFMGNSPSRNALVSGNASRKGKR
jgi:hypothetical protein